MDRQAIGPVFETSRLRLRPRLLWDTAACLSLDSDPEVTRFVVGPWQDPAAHRAFIEARTRGPYPPGLGYWSIFRRIEPETFLGWVLLIPVDAKGPEIEIGWRLIRTAWGQGIATEAAGALLRHAFVTLMLPVVIAEIDVENRRSQSVAEKLGLQRTGLAAHGSRPHLRYAITREAFHASATRLGG